MQLQGDGEKAAANGSEENTETGIDDAPMRATMHVDAAAGPSFMAMLEDELTTDEKEPPAEATLLPISAAEAQSTEHLLARIIGHRSQSLAPPVEQIEKGETAIEKVKGQER